MQKGTQNLDIKVTPGVLGTRFFARSPGEKLPGRKTRTQSRALDRVFANLLSVVRTVPGITEFTDNLRR